jgi:L-asparaginase
VKRVACFASGGTIVAAYDQAAGGYLSSLDPADIVSAIPRVADLAEIEVVELGRRGSTSLDPLEIFEWSGLVAQTLERGEVCGAVVIQGTNTLEECAYLFDLAIASEKPVVFTGAMRPPGALGFDGTRNVAAAIAVAADERSRNLGTLVVMNDEIHLASEVEKSHASAVDAFQTPDLGPVGVLDDEGRPVLLRLPVDHERVPTQRIETRVGLLAAALGDDGSFVDAAVEMGFVGLVVAGMGMGDLPKAMGEALVRAVDRGVVGVVARRASSGRVAPIYAETGEGQWLASRGVLFAPGLSATKARIKLMLAMGCEQKDGKLAGFDDFAVTRKATAARG